MVCYPDSIEEKLGFRQVRALIRSRVLSPMGERQVDAIRFGVSYEKILRGLQQTGEFMDLLEEGLSFPADHFIDMMPVLERIAVEGTVLTVEELYDLRRSLDTMRALVRFAEALEEERYPLLKELLSRLNPYPFITGSIDKVLTARGSVRDTASPELKKIRHELAAMKKSVSVRLQGILRKARAAGWVESDTTLSVRGGRMVIPVPATHKRRIPGLILDESATGKTVYVEPSEIVEMNNGIRTLGFAEEREIEHILRRLTDAFRPYLPELTASYELLGVIDMIRAKALFARAVHAVVPEVQEQPVVRWQKAVHPLLWLTLQKEKREVVPLDIELDEQQRIIVISGPNAGGKSVCLQTVGLLQYMLQSGIPVPVAQTSRFGIFRQIFLDMGDEQSIENDLSTYSSRLLNMKYFLRHADGETLLLMDELGTGTEPLLGGALAATVLRRLNAAGAYGVVTTHYANLKHLAASEKGLVNGAMLFDHQNLRPLYRLDIGKPGSSFAFEMARKTGLPEDVLQEAAGKVGEEHVLFDKHLKEILRDKRYWENKRKKIRQTEKRLETLLERYEQEMEELRREKKDILSKAQEEAGRLLSDVNRKIENTIRVIRETQAEKERTKAVRRELEEVKEKVKEDLTDDRRLERKVEQLRARRRRKGDGEKEKEEETVFREGDKVRLQGQETVGEVVAVGRGGCLVAFGNLTTQVAPERLERVSEEEYRRQTRSKGRGASWQEDLRMRQLHFRPEIDVRGKRAEEALQEVMNFLDEAVMVGESHLRIIHGKGNGILRQMIRDYLHTVGVVARYHDEHVDRGGAGVTIVELEF
jgi:DNA mismatch repair protein MutS2